AGARGAVVDAVDELHIPDRSLYLLDDDFHPIKPAVVPDWIRDAFRHAAQAKHGYSDVDAPDGHELRVYVERFSGTTGTPYVAAGQEREPSGDAAAFQAIEREAARLGEITGELLTLARADAGEWPVVREALYLDDAVAGAVDAARARAGQRQVFVEVGAFEEA